MAKTKQKKAVQNFEKCNLWILDWLEKFSSIMPFIARVYIANIFWKSGLTKIEDWGKTVALFREEYKTPFLSPEIAATFATATELSMPIALVLGVATRLAALPLLFMTAVIDLTYAHYEEHYYWAILLGFILFYGPGKISVDHFLVKKFCPYRGDKAKKLK